MAVGSAVFRLEIRMLERLGCRLLRGLDPGTVQPDIVLRQIAIQRPRPTLSLTTWGLIAMDAPDRLTVVRAGEVLGLVGPGARP